MDSSHWIALLQAQVFSLIISAYSSSRWNFFKFIYFIGIRQGGFCQVPLPYMRLDRGRIRGWGHEFQVRCGDLFHSSILFFIWIEFQMNIFKYFCVLDWTIAHLSLFLAAISLAARLRAHFFSRFPLFKTKY